MADQQENTQKGKRPVYNNKQRCLVVCTRGVTARYRHFLEDIRTLLPHHKKESKLDTPSAVQDICALRGCNTMLMLECRKKGQDAYMWMGCPGKVTVRFHLANVHTMDELRLTGNCVKGSRPLLSFDAAFDRLGNLKLIKALCTDIFGVPKGHPKSKPFVDRVMCFYYLDKRIWVRHYQIVPQDDNSKKEADASSQLVEIGPRFVLDPIRIFRGDGLGGQTLYQNEEFVSPNAIRAAARVNHGRVYNDRKESERARKRRREAIHVPEDPLDAVFK